jgi:hypothetical protein
MFFILYSVELSFALEGEFVVPPLMNYLATSILGILIVYPLMMNEFVKDS